MKPHSLHAISFWQALGVVVYCLVIASFMFLMEQSSITSPGMLGIAVFLLVFVLSAAIVGSCIFGYAVWLALNKKLRDGLLVVGGTLAWLLFFVVVGVVITAIVSTF